MNESNYDLKLPINLPPDIKQEIIFYLVKWLPIIIKMTYAEIQSLCDLLKDNNYRLAMKTLMDKLVEDEVDPYLIGMGNSIVKDWKKSADDSAKRKEMLNEGSIIALKIIGSLLIALI